VIAAAFSVALLSSAPERRELLHRWQQASKANVPSSRQLSGSAPGAAPAPLLRALAAHELAIPGRYTLTAAAPQPKPIPTWWQRLWQWLADRWAALWKGLFSRIHVGRSGATTIGDVLIAFAAVVLLLAAFRLLGELQVERRGRSRFTSSENEPIRAHELYERACALARQGEYAAAARLLFSAMVAALDVRGLVRDDRTSTVGELRSVLRSHDAALVPAFNDVASAFVAATFAERPVEAREWERARDAYRALAGDAPA